MSRPTPYKRSGEPRGTVSQPIWHWDHCARCGHTQAEHWEGTGRKGHWYHNSIGSLLYCKCKEMKIRKKGR